MPNDVIESLPDHDHEDPDLRRKWLRAVEVTGSPTVASRAVGVSEGLPYKWRQKDPRFAEAWRLVLDMRSERLLSLAHDHVQSHLEDRWTEELDDDFELRRVSQISAKDLALLIGTIKPREMAAATQVNVTVNSAPAEPLTDEQITLELEAIAPSRGGEP